MLIVGASNLRALGMSSAIETVARFAAELSFEDIPRDVVTRAKILIVHHLAVASSTNAYAKSLDAPRVVTKIARHELNASGRCTIIGNTLKTPPNVSAFVNSVLMHSIQQEETSMQIPHAAAGCCFLPAILAVGELQGSSGREIINATVIAYETSIRLTEIGSKTGPCPFRMPYLIFGATAGVGRILRLTEKQIALALGAAAEFPSGLGKIWMTEGTIGSVLSVANQAQNSVVAAYMGKRNSPASTKALEHQNGFYSAYAGSVPKPTVIKESLSKLNREFDIRKMVSKPYACFTHVQSTVEAVLTTMRRYRLKRKDISDVEVRLSPRRFTHNGSSGFSDSPGPFSSIYKAFSSHPLAISLAVHFGQVQIEHMLKYENTKILQFAKDHVKLKLEKNRKDFCPQVTITTVDGTRKSYEHTKGIVEPSLDQILERLEQTLMQNTARKKVRRVLQLARQFEKIEQINDLTSNLA